MLKSTLSKSLAAVVLGAAGVLAPIGQADAGVFVGTFDPSFGGSLDSLGFRGQATFFIPDACLGFTGPVSNSSECSDGAMNMTSATVDLYRFPTPATTLHTAVFGARSVDSIFLGLPGELLAVNTEDPNESNSVNVTVADAATIYAGPLWLQFFFPTVIIESDVFLAIAPGSEAGAYIFACDPTVTDECSQIQSNVALVTFTQVPEPATIGLLLVALAGAVMGRRRGKTTA